MSNEADLDLSFSKINLTHYQGFTPARLNELGFKKVNGLTVWHNRRPNVSTSFFALQQKTMLKFMQDLNLSLYQSAEDDLLFGATDENLHPHERWLYHSFVSASSTWYEIRHHALDKATGQNGLGGYGISTRAKKLEESLLNHAIQFGKLQAETSSSQYWRMHAARYGYGQSLLDLLDKNPLSAVDLHDLMNHYPDWLQRNSEFAGLPQEIVQRMHGLGVLLDIDLNNEW